MDILYVPGYYEEVGKIVKQAREMGITVPIVGADGWDSPKLGDCFRFRIKQYILH